MSTEGWENERNGREREISLEESEHFRPLFRGARRYWPSACSEGISAFRDLGGSFNYLPWEIFHGNDSITCGDVCPYAIMLTHLIRHARTSSVRDQFLGEDADNINHSLKAKLILPSPFFLLYLNIQLMIYSYSYYTTYATHWNI